MKKILQKILAVILRAFSFFNFLFGKADGRRRLICIGCVLLILVSGISASAMEIATEIETESGSESESVSQSESESESDSDYRRLSFEIYPDEKKSEMSITLNGIMPKDASPEAVDVTDDYSDADDFDIKNTKKSSEENQEISVLAAYDITINNGDYVYQPDEENPIHVEIMNPDISSEKNTTLWHIKDDGTREEVTDFVIEDGKISFYATGFSVYAIVETKNPASPSQSECVTSVDDLTDDRAEDGFFLYYTTSASVDTYFTSALNSNDALIETDEILNASVFYFEQDGNYYKLYTYVNGQKKYIHTKSGNTIELSDRADLLEISSAPTQNTFFIKKKNENRWLQHSNSGGGIRYYTANNNVVNARIKMSFAGSASGVDYYNLDGETYGLMNYQGGTLGYAFMADDDNNSLSMVSLLVRSDNQADTLYVSEDSDITEWTFHWTEGFQYKISTEINGQTKYLNIGNTLSLVDEEDATEISVSVNVNHQINLSANGKSVTLDEDEFVISNRDSADRNQWLFLTEPSGLSNDDYVSFSSQKVSVSEVPDGSKVILYTRVWNEQQKRYDFYAVDHDGTLYPCYERGDYIMWVGSKINTLLWDFTEYHYDDGSPNYYYELYNPYSRKYIAPQIGNGQTLSDTKIGINLPGRREGEYYTDIIAWDNPYYSYASLQADIANDQIISGNRFDADTFYFALIETPTPTLTKVDTLDNDDYGITMRMIDFPGADSYHNGSGGTYQNNFLGTSNTYNAQGATPGILSTNLNGNGYPTAVRTGRVLSDLYNGANDVNHLFIKSIYEDSGYFEFDSCQNFATLIQEDGTRGEDFIVYKELGTSGIQGGRTSLAHGQFLPYDTITAGVYSDANPLNLYSALALPSDASAGLLPESDPRKYEKLHTVGTDPNYFNGMEMSANFVQTPGGKDPWGHDIIFEFTGDDDFWLYVDGELVIDLGGIHSALAGKVNFATGEVVVDKTTTTLRALFESNYRKRNPDATNAEVENYLSDYFDPGETVFRDYSAHSMKIFYMERGASASNLHMRFNFSAVTPGNVILTKNVSGSDDVDFNMVEYPYQIYYKLRGENAEYLLENDNNNIRVRYQNMTQHVDYMQTYTPPGSSQSYNSVYLLDPGKSAEISFPMGVEYYRIVECGINSEVYDHVSVNGEEITGVAIGNTNRKCFNTGWLDIDEKPSIVFDNHVDEEALRTLSFQKKLYDESEHELTAQQDSTTFSFRLYLTNGIDDNLELANMVDYYVRDPQGYLCRWDVTNQTFVATENTSVAQFSDSEKEEITFQTSMNGAISMIPAGYTVEVPNLPVGMRFKVDERSSEIPIGYKWLRYERESGTYRVDEDGSLNTGWIRENESPKMYICNKRGWGLEAKKVWSDNNYVSSHDDIFTAVYIGNTLVPDTVRQVKHPATSVRYFFENLQTGSTFNDYVVYEVTLQNPTFDGNGNLTGYDSVQRISEGSMTTINSVARNSSTPAPHSYVVTYDSEQQDPNSTGNVRTDIITNTRTEGIVITLYDMITREPLANGTFTLKQGDDLIGTFTSASDGRITILYDFEHDTDYTLEEISAPHGYIGLPNAAVFSIDDENEVTISGNESQWETGYKSEIPGDSVVAYIDVFNKPFTLQAIKIDSETEEGISGAHFALYRGVSALGGIERDFSPIPGYENLVTTSNGTIPLIDNTLPAGTYYLSETAPPTGYDGLAQDIIFTITSLGEVVIESIGHQGYLTENNSNGTAYIISIPNEQVIPDAELTITKDVEGTFCNRAKQFTFTLTVAGAQPEDEFEWTKNGIPQENKLHSGGTFTLKHGDDVTITLPTDTNITITENSEEYTAEFQLGNGQAETVNTKTFVLQSDTTLEVTNTLNYTVPTGIMIYLVAVILLLIGAGIFIAVIIKNSMSSQKD